MRPVATFNSLALSSSVKQPYSNYYAAVREEYIPLLFSHTDYKNWWTPKEENIVIAPRDQKKSLAAVAPSPSELDVCTPSQK